MFPKKIASMLSRHCQERVVLQLCEDTFAITGNAEYLRVGKVDDQIDFVDFDGGPYFELGGPVFWNPELCVVTIVEAHSADDGQTTVRLIAKAR